MYPELLKLGPLTVHSYGLMLGIAFIVASWLLNKEFKRRDMDINIATTVTLLAIVFGIAGSKLFHLAANPGDLKNDFFGAVFSPAGLTFHGGLLTAMLAIYIYLRKKGIPFLVVADSTAPGLAIAYGIGRIGCHLAGDGDYGIPTTLPWGTDYSNGVVKPSLMFQGSDIAAGYPNGIVPDNTPLHPTPVYEFLIMVLVFWLLWKIRKREMPDGLLFSYYLILAGTERLLIEFIRLNPRLLLGLSEAQLIALALITAGSAGAYYYTKINNHKPRFVAPPELRYKEENSASDKTGSGKKKTAGGNR
ncbi:MAG: prolipoprotein diacylglyceryl transferase [Ignavibacteriaceae bacterium]|nr:prolipoprotein diacylglyceryl transferase [Ignavibacteriaceae bacterium]NUM72007.1 prolipoprotein diacylglyceryl transferase [Ignavibacteriaceae bacterium]